MNMLDNDPKVQESKRENLTSFPPTPGVSYPLLPHLGKWPFTVGNEHPSTFTKALCVELEKFPWLVLNQRWVKNGVIFKGKCMILLQVFLLLATDAWCAHRCHFPELFTLMKSFDWYLVTLQSMNDGRPTNKAPTAVGPVHRHREVLEGSVLESGLVRCQDSRVGAV